MNFFPSVYPDEVIYSVLGRYAIRSGNIKEIHNFEDLFSTRNCIASIELPSKIDALIENMPVTSIYTAEYFINNHTLFPFLSAFTPQSRAEQIITSMRSGTGSLSYLKAGLISQKINLHEYLRFCPKCFQEDTEKYGEPYWHRVHQITGVFVCPKHRTPICNSKVLMRQGNRQRFINASINNCNVLEVVQYSENYIEKMMWMAEDATEILNGKFEFREQEWFEDKFRIALIEKGYARMNNYIHQKLLRKEFIDFYSEDYLELLQSPIPDVSQNWLSSMIRNNVRTTYSLRYLLLARFLEIPLDDLFGVNEKMNYDNGGSQQNTKEVNQALWDERLKELLNLNLSIRECGKILESSTITISKAIERLGIKPYWKYNGGGKYLKQKYIDTDEFTNKRNDSRNKWLELLEKHPDKSSNFIRQDNQALYRWLTKYDIDWLRLHARISNKKTNPVDWKKRDEELLSKVKEIVKEMREGKPDRVTWTTISGRLAISGWFSKKKDKIPITKEYVESVIENLQEFQIRKIEWTINELERQGKNITFWNLVETAGVKARYIKSISKEIEEMLVEKRYEDALISKMSDY